MRTEKDYLNTLVKLSKEKSIYRENDIKKFLIE